MKQNSKWGSSEWFSKKLIDDGVSSPDSYFAYEKNAFQNLRIKAVLKFVKKHVILRIDNPKILDIGSATGFLTSALKQTLNSDNILGIDFSEDLVNHANNLYDDIEFKVGALPDLSYKDNSYDFLSLIEVLYYLPETDRKKALEECRRVMKKDGLMLFCSNISKPPYLLDKEILDLLSSTGFEITTSLKLDFSGAVALQGFLMRLKRFLKRAILLAQNYFITRVSLGKIFEFFELIIIFMIGWNGLFSIINTLKKFTSKKNYTHSIMLLQIKKDE